MAAPAGYPSRDCKDSRPAMALYFFSAASPSAHPPSRACRNVSSAPLCSMPQQQRRRQGAPAQGSLRRTCCASLSQLGSSPALRPAAQPLACAMPLRLAATAAGLRAAAALDGDIRGLCASGFDCFVLSAFLSCILFSFPGEMLVWYVILRDIPLVDPQVCNTHTLHTHTTRSSAEAAP